MELVFEYSLYTVSLYESKWKKAFMKALKNPSKEDELRTFQACCITDDVPPICWALLTNQMKTEIHTYMSDPFTATTIRRDDSKPPSRKLITSEQIYMWMFQLGIPIDCEHWHFNRLMRLIEVGFLQNAPKKKMSAKEAMRQQSALNEARLRASGSRG